MDSTARNVFALAALIFLPLLHAYCPRLAPDVISGKIIPCRYLCIRINFFEMPSIILSTERDGVLCSTLLLRRRGVCKNGGCYPFEPEDQKPKGIFRKVITNIDKFASGSYRKSALKPGEPSGPIVSVLPSLLVDGSKSATANDTSPLPSGPPSSTSGSRALSAGTSSLVKAVGSSLASIWTHAFPLDLKAGPPRAHSAASEAHPSTPPQTPGGTIAASTDRAAAVNFGGGPPSVPPMPANGDNIPGSGTSRGPKLFGQVPGLTAALSFGRTLINLRGRSPASTASTGKPLAPVAGINAGNTVGVREGEAGSVAGTSGTNAVKMATGAPKVPPRATAEASQGEKSGNGPLPGSPTIPAAAINAGNVGPGTPGSEVRMSQPNASIISGPSIAAPLTTQGSGKASVASGAPIGLGSSRLIGKLRTVTALGGAINKLKRTSLALSAGPRIPSSPAGQSGAVTNTGVSKAISSVPPVSSLGAHRGMPSEMAPAGNNEAPASVRPGRKEPPGVISGPMSVIGLDKILNLSRGGNSGAGPVLNSPSHSTAEVNTGSAASNRPVVTINSVPEENTNLTTSPPTPLTSSGRNSNGNVAAQPVGIGGRPATVSGTTEPEPPRVSPPPSVETQGPRNSSLISESLATPPATPLVPGPHSPRGLSELTGSSSTAGGSANHPGDAAASVSPPAGSTEASSVGPAAAAAGETGSQGSSTNRVSPPKSTLPVSKSQSAPTQRSNIEASASNLFSKFRSAGAAVTSPVTGGAAASGKLVRNFLGISLSRRLTA